MVKHFRRRYVAFRLRPPLLLSAREMLTKIMESVIETHGREDLEKYHLRIIDYDPDTGLCIVRCDHRAVKALLSAFTASTKPFRPSSVATLATSGTIKTLRRKFLINAPR